jgi:hypothetical protein
MFTVPSGEVVDVNSEAKVPGHIVFTLILSLPPSAIVVGRRRGRTVIDDLLALLLSVILSSAPSVDVGCCTSSLISASHSGMAELTFDTP